ncbi:SDR family oxidoreductase [Nocardia sp. NPDC052112]|uniref:SDR family oxidoreductase n=1 Tax=Nocardia sp. NPDC052112 TaxID=3155646 RepID=UPI00342B8CC8
MRVVAQFGYFLLEFPSDGRAYFRHPLVHTGGDPCHVVAEFDFAIATKGRHLFIVGTSGAFFLSQAALAHMVERGTGRIVNVSTVVGETGNIGQANYAASESGLFGLTKTLAKEAAFQLARSGKRSDDSIGITVNTVTPGLVTTDMTAAIPEKVMHALTGRIPVGRAGRPEEIARVVHFLAADASSYITGQVWSVNGRMDM